jgi:hypothetical protein
MVSTFVLDYMHLLCLGVMRRLIWLWLCGPVGGGFRLRAKTVNEISDVLVRMRPFVPHEFARKRGHFWSGNDGKQLNSDNFCCTLD